MAGTTWWAGSTGRWADDNYQLLSNLLLSFEIEVLVLYALFLCFVESISKIEFREIFIFVLLPLDVVGCAIVLCCCALRLISKCTNENSCAVPWAEPI